MFLYFDFADTFDVLPIIYTILTGVIGEPCQIISVKSYVTTIDVISPAHIQEKISNQENYLHKFSLNHLC